MAESAVAALCASWRAAHKRMNGATSGTAEADAIVEMAGIEESLVGTPGVDHLDVADKLAVALEIGGEWAWDLVRSAAADLRAV